MLNIQLHPELYEEHETNRVGIIARLTLYVDTLTLPKEWLVGKRFEVVSYNILNGSLQLEEIENESGTRCVIES